MYMHVTGLKKFKYKIPIIMNHARSFYLSWFIYHRSDLKREMGNPLWGLATDVQ